MFFCNFDKLPQHNLGKCVNVILFGEAGGGKSASVELLLGKNVAKVRDPNIDSTFKFQVYETPNYTLYDTVGLSEECSVQQQSTASNQLVSLLKRLEDGISLLIFAVEKGKLQKSHVENYKLFVDEICMRKVPVILMVTHSELDPNPDKWWQENKCFFNKYKMHFDAVVCGSFKTGETGETLNGTTVSKLREAINAKILVPGWKLKGGWMNWFTTILSTVLTRLGTWYGAPLTHFFPSGDAIFQDRLYTYFLHDIGYDQFVARSLANDIANFGKQTDEIFYMSREEAPTEGQRSSVNVRG